MKNKIACLFVLIFWLIVTTVFGQIELKHFNAGWNEANNVSWFMDLKDAKTKGYTDIAKDTEAQAKYKIAVVPTIIIVARCQADLSFKMVATKEEIQEEIDNQLMSDF